MILLFTDFSWKGPYVGQMKSVLAARLPGRPVVDLMHDAPAFRPLEAGLLLVRLLRHAPAGAALLGVVDPGVGGARRALILEVEGRVLAGPDNGLFVPALRAASRARCFEVLWRPPALSASFHGRDLFAPALASHLAGEPLEMREIEASGLAAWDAPNEPGRVLYIDGYGNAMTGIDATELASGRRLSAGGRDIAPARTFSDVQEGEVFCYGNSLGLVEIAVNKGSAAALLGLEVGSAVALS
jgi:S-adenosylmethionine hydrolase